MSRFLVVSSDSHAERPLERYREYLDPQNRDAFDASLAAILDGNAARLCGIDPESLGPLVDRLRNRIKASEIKAA